MKLDTLRARLRVARKPKPAQKPPTKKRRMRCSKCRKPREPASLSDPDVVEILAAQAGMNVGEFPLCAYRCRGCSIVWIAYKRAP